MMNTITISGQKAVINYDPDIDMFRGEFTGLNGGADFYAKDIDSLKKEGAVSLKVFYEACAERNIDPIKSYSGKFNTRVSPKLHADIVAAATAENKSLNQWVSDTLDIAAHG